MMRVHPVHLRIFTTLMLRGCGLLLAAIVACTYGVQVSATPVEINESQRIERGSFEDYGCFGSALDAEAGVAVVGNPCHEGTSGEAYAFAVGSNGLWEETWRYSKGPGYEDDVFGAAVAIDAGRVVIGEPAITGSMHFYRVLENGGLDYVRTYRYPIDWSEIPGDGFGARLALDGDTVVSGSRFYRRVYIMEEQDGDWTELKQLAAATIFDLEGNTILIGDPDDDAAGADAGAVRALYRDASGDWQEGSPIWPEDPLEGQAFGQSVAIDGGRALVSASGRSTDEGAAGVAYVFEQDATGVWRQVARLDEAGGSACPMEEPYRGTRTVALSGDIALVGCRSDARPAVVFARQPGGAWTLVARLAGVVVTPDSAFGAAMAIDESWVFIGAPGQPHSGSEDELGVVYVFNLAQLNPVRLIEVDAQPWSTGNVVDAGSPGLLAVALLSGADFDALQTDLRSLRLDPGEAPARNYRTYDVNHDAIPDLLAWFRIRDLRIGCGRTELVLTGRTHAGESMLGRDVVINRRCPAP